jgi:hypothetical protein
MIIATAEAPGSTTLISTAFTYEARPTLAVKVLVSCAACSATVANSFQSSDVNFCCLHFNLI